MVLADSGRISPVPPYSGYCSSLSIYAYGAITLYGSTFQKIQLDEQFLNAVLQPSSARRQVWAIPFSLATTQGIIIIFFSSAYLDVSVQGLALLSE
jgi:hypothetical protein